jgi:lambda repressor-like predicted transcriptional regulator
MMVCTYVGGLSTISLSRRTQLYRVTYYVVELDEACNKNEAIINRSVGTEEDI